MIPACLSPDRCPRPEGLGSTLPKRVRSRYAQILCGPTAMTPFHPTKHKRLRLAGNRIADSAYNRDGGARITQMSDLPPFGELYGRGPVGANLASGKRR